MSDVWRWVVGPGRRVMVEWGKPPTWDDVQQFDAIWQVTKSAFAPPAVAPKEIGGVRVIRIEDPRAA